MTLHTPTPTINIPPAPAVTPDPRITAWAEAELAGIQRCQRAWGHHADVCAAIEMTSDQLRIAHAAATPDAMLLAASEILEYHDDRVSEDPHADWSWLADMAAMARSSAVMYGPGF